MHYTKAPTKFDIFLIPGGDIDIMNDTAFMEYIKRAANDSTFVLSVCTGATFLAATGLLDGRNATTNKIYFKPIAALHPRVNWIHKARWVVDGKFWTSSGVTAGTDMAYAFMVDQYGKKEADLIARVLEVVPSLTPRTIHTNISLILRIRSHWIPKSQRDTPKQVKK